MVNSVGASGAICGIIGATLAFMFDQHNHVPFPVLKQQASGLLVLIVYSFIDAIKGVPIDHAAHIGGLLFGFLGGFVFLKFLKIEKASTKVLYCVIVLVGYAFILLILNWIGSLQLSKKNEMGLLDQNNIFLGS